MAGPQSKEIQIWMVTAVESFFKENGICTIVKNHFLLIDNVYYCLQMM